MSSSKVQVAVAIFSLLLLSAVSVIIPDDSAGSFDERNDIRSIEIPLQFHGPELTHTGHGVEVHIPGVDMDPRSSAYSIPRLPISLDLPVNSKIVSLEIVDHEISVIPLDGYLARNPIPVPSADPSLFDRTLENIPVPRDHMEYNVGTGLDLESQETVLKLPIFIYPAIARDGDLISLTSGTLRINFELPKAGPIDGPVQHDLLVICPDIFKDQMDEYALFRNLTGFDAMVVTLSDIADDVYWDISDNDTQEEMKRFIYNARLEWSIDYVLLVGDSNVMPAREIMVLDGYDDNGNSDGRFLPSDLYFADLFEDGTTDFCTWNEYRTDYHDLLWGEYNGGNLDDLDLYPDVSIGRIPAGSTSELTLMLDKVTNYELSAMGSTWFMNATVCGTDTFPPSYGETSGVAEGEYMSDLISAGPLSEFNTTKHYESLSNLTSIASTVNKGCGFFEMSDHGNYDGWGYTTTGVAVRSSMAYGLDNGYKLPVVILDACLTHGFDNENASNGAAGLDPVTGYSYYPPGPSYANRDCIGEYFHKAPNGGGIATYGCTRVGYGGWGTSYKNRNSGYMNLHIHEAYADGYDQTGDMLTKAVEDYMNNIGPGGYASFKTITEYILLGDPTVTVGGVNGANIAVTSGMMEMDILPNQTVELDFNMTNTGFLSSSIAIEPVIVGGGNWIASVTPENGSIDPDQTINGTLTVTAPWNAIMGTLKTISVKVDSPIMSEPRSVNIVFTVGRRWELDLVSDPSSTSCYQRGRVAGHLNLSNLGNGPETIHIAFTDLPAEWNLTLPSPTIDMGPFDEERVPFQIGIPDRCPAGIYDLTINASSTIDPAFVVSRISVEIKKEYGLELETDIARMDALPGTYGTFGLTVSNLGNSEVIVDLGWGRTDLNGWGLMMESEEVTIGPFSDTIVTVSVGVPDLAPPMTYRVFVNATDGVVLKTTSVVINVSKVYSYIATCNDISKFQNGSGSTYFDIDISNLGNIFNVFTVSMMDNNNSNWSFSTSARELSVDPQNTRTVRVSFSNMFPHTGNYTFSVQIEPYSNVPSTVIDLVVIVPPLFNFTIDGEMIIDRALPGSEMTGIVHVSSLSNCNDTYLIQAIPPEGFEVILDATEPATGPGGDLYMGFRIVPPMNALAGQYPVEIRVRSIGSEMVLSRSLMIEVEEVYNISIQTVSVVQENLLPDGTYIIEFNVKNYGNVRDNVDVKWNSSEYIQDWIRIEGASFSRISPGENRTIRVIIYIPARNVTGGNYNISISVTSFGDEAATGNISLSIEGSKDQKLSEKIDWTVTSMALAMAAVILIIAIVLAVMFIRKRSGEDLEDLGMEWESDDEEDDDWDDDEDLEWDDDE